MGKAVLAEDGRLAAVPAGTWMPTPIGIGDGAGAVRFLGVTSRVRTYATKNGRERVMTIARKSMQNVGRGLALSEQPEAVACLIRYVLTRPAVLVFTYVDGVPTLTAWAGRGLTGWLSLRRAIRAFEIGLPDTMVGAEGKLKKEKKPPKEKKEKKEKKKKKGEAKEETPTQEAPADEAQEVPVEEAQEVPTQDAPADEPQDVPTEDVPADEAQEVPADETAEPQDSSIPQ